MTTSIPLTTSCTVLGAFESSTTNAHFMVGGGGGGIAASSCAGDVLTGYPRRFCVATSFVWSPPRTAGR
ncbi:hypothetical protein ACHAXH_008245 [Discostella pseudostelligera]